MIRAQALDATTIRWTLEDADARPASFRGVVEGWRSSPGFRDTWCTALGGVPFGAYAWECPPVTASTAARQFGCVFVASPALTHMRAEPSAFAEHFRPDRPAVTFANLGGDATLVAPCPVAGNADFAHLARFVATAPVGQQDAFWQAVGEAMARRIGDRPVWLSTAGLGIGWLHVRLDDRPKYYRYAPYIRFAGEA